MYENDVLIFLQTKNHQEAVSKLAAIVSWYLQAYEEEKKDYADRNGLDPIEDEYDSTKEEYSEYLTDLWWGFRERVQQHKEKDSKAALAYILANFTRLHETEINNLTKTADLSVAIKHQQNNPGKRVYKKWVAHSGACQLCQAMNGTIVPVDEPFLYQGQRIDLENEVYQYDYVDRYTPIAHPNDKCSIEIFIE